MVRIKILNEAAERLLFFVLWSNFLYNLYIYRFVYIQICIYTCDMKVQLGSPVEGDNFFGREKELAYVWSLINDGNNIILPSPRRVGKTSFALKMLEKASAEGLEVIDINLEKHTESGFVEALTQRFIEQSSIEKFKERGKNLLKFINDMKPSLEVAGAKFAFNWQENHTNIYQQLDDLLDHDKPTLIFLDELTVLLTKMVKEENGLDRVTSFLHWLRDARIKKGTKIKWIYCSSVGIENFTHKYNLSEAMNDVPNFELKSFDHPTSIHMVNRLAANYELVLPRGITQGIVSKLVYCLPYFLQLMFEKIRLLHSVEDRPLEVPIVEEAYILLIEQDHFNTWIERIEKQYDDLQVHAFSMLRHACKVPVGVSRDSLFNLLMSKVNDQDEVERILSKLIYMLKNDGYLILEDEKYTFRSPLLRDFWLNRFVK